MKNLILACSLVLAPLMASAVSYNPFVNAGVVSPAPLLPAEFAGTGVLSFHTGNTGGDDLLLVVGQEMKLDLTLSDGIPNTAVGSELSALGGTALAYFNWSYNAGTKTYTGVQNQTIPAQFNGTVTIQYKVTVNSFLSGTPQNGFNVNLTPPAGRNDSGSDDSVSSYTYVQAFDFGDAPASYDSGSPARHEISLVKDNSGDPDYYDYYRNYMYLGSYVDPEPTNQPSSDAKGDDNNKTGGLNVNDEDGVTFPAMTVGTTVTIPVVVTIVDETYVNTVCKLSAWIDWNGDGDFLDAGERIATNITISASGTYYLRVKVPADAITGRPTFARFRLGPSVSGPTGSAAYGEVEDYQIGLLDPTHANLSGNVYDDANGLTDSTVNGTGTSVGGQLYANLVSGGNVVRTVAVGADGTYAFNSIPSDSYTVQVTVNPGTVGQAMPATVLPSGWVNTGENLGAGAGSDGTANGLLAVTVPGGANVINANFGIQQAFSLGNRVFADNGAGGGTANDGIQNGTEPGISGVVVKLFAADGSGNPTGSVLATQTTDSNGYYRFDGLTSGKYVAVVDVANSANLAGTASSTGASTYTTISGDLKDHGKDTPVSVGGVVNGIASMPVTLGVGPEPTGEAVGSGAGAHGPNGDSSDNLVLDFGFYTPSPTAAAFAWLGAYVDQGQVRVTWQTYSESGLLGFDVGRSTAGAAEQLVTVSPVLADGRSMGYRYTIADSSARLPGEYTYRLVGYYDDGSAEELARVKVSLAADASVDVVRITGIEATGDGMRVRWLGGQPPYVLESSPSLGPDAAWSVVGPAEAGETEALVPPDGQSGFFRVRLGEQ